MIFISSYFLLVINRAQFSVENFAKFRKLSLFAKFCGLPWQNCSNSTAHRSLPFVSKMSSILFKNFSF